MSRPTTHRVLQVDETSRRLLALAVPTLGALLAQPTMVLIDTAMVGHLGPEALAALAAGSTVVNTVVGLLIFLAYATTAAVARAVGAERRADAMRYSVEGLWFALFNGVLAAIGVWAGGPWIIRVLGTQSTVAPLADGYLRAAAPGIVGMLVVYAATGALRGFSRVNVVLVVTVLGATANVIFNAILIYGLGWGVVGSGAGTALAESCMAVALTVILLRDWAAHGMARTQLRPSLAGFRRVGAGGWPLFVRTLAMRVALLLTLWAATSLGVIALSAHQIVLSSWFWLANALDAIAIAAQTLIGESLGAGRRDETRQLLHRCVRWGSGVGVGLGVLIALLSPILPRLFVTDADARRMAMFAFLVAASALPLAGLVCVLDGVLIGAGDGVYLAWTSVVNLAVYLPPLLLVGWYGHGQSGLLWLWLAYAWIYFGARGLTLWLRSRDERWMTVTE